MRSRQVSAEHRADTGPSNRGPAAHGPRLTEPTACTEMSAGQELPDATAPGWPPGENAGAPGRLGAHGKAGRHPWRRSRSA